MVSGTEALLERRLEMLRTDFVSRLPQDVLAFAASWQALGGDDAGTALARLRDRIAGSYHTAASFGYRTVAGALQRLECLTALLAARGCLPDPGQRAQWQLLLDELRAAVAHRRNLLHPSSPEIWRVQGDSDRHGAVCIVDGGGGFAEELVSALHRRGLRTEVFAGAPAWARRRTNLIVRAVVLELDAGMEPRRTAWLPRLGAREGNPLFVVSGSDTLDVRLQAVRLGAQRFFTLPVDPAVLVDALAESCTGIPPEPYRVLVAGRDPVLSRFFAQLLEDAGMQAVVAAGAEEALQAIYRFQPELIFAGADLGECAGAEFARIVRQQDKFSGIAVMLAAPGEGSVPASDAAGACADDLIATPISPARFVAAVSARVTRFRTLGRMTYSLLSTRRELENQQRAIDRHSALSITDCDGRFVFVNELFCSLSGYGRHELLGRHIDLLASELHEQAFFTRMLDTLREGTIWHGEICKRRKDGGLYWVSATVTPCADVSGGIYQYVVIENDVTERVRAERQLLEARDAALGASQAKSAFLSSLSHELRTPLNAIIGYSQMLRDSGADLSAGRVADHAGAIARAGNHLLEIINDLLDLSRIEARQLRMDPGQVPVTALLDDCCALVAPLARAREIRIDRTGDETRVPLLQADPVRLKQVLVNLLSNAVKYNRQGGTVAILVAWDGAGQCRIEVTDSGAGIPPEFLPDLFRPFSRLPAHVRHEGAGIGLALCRELMTLMEGEIGVRSNPGQGSTFWITVPVAGTAGTATENVSGPAYPAAALARGTILYVEDTPVNALLVEQILSHRTGHVLRHASDLEGGLRMARTQRPDLILLDLQLPAAGGLEAIARLRQDPATHAVPVVAVAGLADDGVRAAALAAGCAGFLVKPVEVAALCSVVGRLLGDGGAEAG